jgi:SAM-dependent methyltransferase
MQRAPRLRSAPDGPTPRDPLASAGIPAPGQYRGPGESAEEPGSAGPSGRQGLARSIRLFRLFRTEQTNPDGFYAALADDAADQLARYMDLAGRTVVDVGGGAGLFTAAFRSRGAACYLFEPDERELLSRGTVTAGALLADGFWLPVADGSADICFSSNVLEHVPDPTGFIDEMVRATKPGGLIYLSYTNWYSPWGGHEMSPYHLLGAGYAARRYARRYERPPKHTVGQNLFRIHIGPVLRHIRSRNDVRLVDALPRYYPRWCKFVLRIPVLRELVTWNALLIIRRDL